MSLVSLRAAIEDRLQAAIPQAHASTHRGPFTLADVKRIATRSPALVVACLGMPRASREGVFTVCEAAWGVFVITTDKAGIKRDDLSMTLAESVTALVSTERWGGHAMKAASDISSANLYSVALDKEGVALWSVRWRQAVEISMGAHAELHDFKTLAGDTTPKVSVEQTDPVQSQATMETA